MKNEKNVIYYHSLMEDNQIIHIKIILYENAINVYDSDGNIFTHTFEIQKHDEIYNMLKNTNEIYYSDRVYDDYFYINISLNPKFFKRCPT